LVHLRIGQSLFSIFLVVATVPARLYASEDLPFR
jgi:hypothetical protein